MLQSEAAREQSNRPNLKQQGASARRTDLHEKEKQKRIEQFKKRREHVKRPPGSATVEIIRENSDPYASSKLRTQKS